MRDVPKEVDGVPEYGMEGILQLPHVGRDTHTRPCTHKYNGKMDKM